MNFVEFQGIEKEYPGVRALRGVDLDVPSGQVLGLVGKNGAGKSTLIKVLAGVEGWDAGEIRVDGQAVGHAYGTQDARRLGLAFLFQELEIVPRLSVTENILLGNHYARNAGVFVSWRRNNARARAAITAVGLDVDVTLPAGTLKLAQQRLVMLARALFRDARLLVLDEPTEGLSGEETEQLFQIIRQLRTQGRSVIYVSHRLKEVAEITDTTAIMRDGRVVLVKPTPEISYDAVVAAISGAEEVGKSVAGTRQERPDAPKEDRVVLSVEGLSRPHADDGVSFVVRAGEILGLAGLMGSGRSEIVRMIAGVDPKGAGSVFVNGHEVDTRNPHHAMQSGIAYLPENRRDEGLILKFGIRENITMASLRKHRPAPWLPVPARSSELTATRRAIDTLGIVCRGPEQVISTLSGGNQQKVVLAKWMECDVEVVIFDEPTHGVDVQSKSEIMELIAQLSYRGKAIIVIMSEFSELVSMCHRLLVVSGNRICGELVGDEMQESRMVEACYAHM